MVGVADAMTHPATLESRINIVVVRLALSCLRYEPMSELCSVLRLCHVDAIFEF